MIIGGANKIFKKINQEKFTLYDPFSNSLKYSLINGCSIGSFEISSSRFRSATYVIE